jgi:predicted aspartyl protease
VEGNRPFVDITFYRADGSQRSARFLVDTGGGGFLLAEPLARDVGLRWGAAQREEDKEFAVVAEPPSPSIGGVALELEPTRVFVMIGTDNILPPAAPGRAEGMLPGHVLVRYHIVFDYPQGRFTIARHGVLTPRGTQSPMPVAARSGFPRTEVEVDGEVHGFLLDTGASFTMVSEALLKSWGEKHSDWPRHEGADGDAKTLGGQTLETMFVPVAKWGPHELREFGVTSQREGAFERYMSPMMAAPILGALGGNVLKRFRVELDYKNERMYLSTP